ALAILQSWLLSDCSGKNTSGSVWAHRASSVQSPLSIGVFLSVADRLLTGIAVIVVHLRFLARNRLRCVARFDRSWGLIPPNMPCRPWAVSDSSAMRVASRQVSLTGHCWQIVRALS